MTNAAGIVTDRYIYDGFGAERSQTGSSLQPYTYTGEPVDPEAGLVFLRARYYDAVVGRFFSKDRLNAPMIDTQGLNNHSYSANNPISYTDHSGMITNYLEARIAGFMMGAQGSLSLGLYVDTQSGEVQIQYSYGQGSGVGINASIKGGESVGGVPKEGIYLNKTNSLGAIAGEIGTSYEKNLGTGEDLTSISLGASEYSLSSNRDMSDSLGTGVGFEYSQTINRRGIIKSWNYKRLGDWFNYPTVKQAYAAEIPEGYDIYETQSQNYNLGIPPGQLK